MLECLIFGTGMEMKDTLEQLLADFPNVRFSKVGTPESPYQLGIDLGAVDESTFFNWACDTGNLTHCFSLIMKTLENPQPEWIRRELARRAIDEIRSKQQ